MPTLLSLTKDREEALKALSAATTPAAKGKAAGLFETASLALAAFKSELAAKAKDKDMDEEDEEDESDVDEEDEDDEDESDDDDDDKDDDDKDDDDDDDDDEEEEDDEDEDDAKARAAAVDSAKALLASARKGKNKALIASAKANLKSVEGLTSKKDSKLRSTVAELTGKKGTRAQLGALHGLADAAKHSAKVSAKNAETLQRMKTASRKDRVSSMLSTARKDGRIVREEVEHLRAMGMKDPKQLKSYLSVRPKLVRSVDDGPLQGRTAKNGRDGDAPRLDAIDAQALTAEQRKIIANAGAGTGKTFDEFVEAMNNTRSKISGSGKKL